jgi:hypothetical protein
VKYHPDDFLALSSAVLDDGGQMLEDSCEGTEFRLRFESGPMGRPIWKRYKTAHCNQVARFDVPYDPTEAVVIEDEETGAMVVNDAPAKPESVPPPKHARVCAVDDAMGRWPRFKDVVSEKSYLH